MSVKKKSQRQEKDIAKKMSGRVVPASGALWGAKGDVRNEHYLIECKTTDKEYYSLTAKTWQKIYNEALKDGMRIPVMCIEVQKRTFAVLDYTYVESLVPCNLCKGSFIFSNSFRIKKEEQHDLYYTYFCYGDNWMFNNGERKALIVMSWESFLGIKEDLCKIYQ